jgi:hypothetical protein
MGYTCSKLQQASLVASTTLDLAASQSEIMTRYICTGFDDVQKHQSSRPTGAGGLELLDPISAYFNTI